MAGIMTWIRSRFAKGNKSSSQNKEQRQQQKLICETRPGLPFLPPQLPGVLTPISSLADGSSSISLLQNYGMFGRLPYELRRQILIEAFGSRRLHIHLSYGYPLSRKPTTALDRKHCGLGIEVVPDHAQPLAWQWFGCVCHRPARYSEHELEQRKAADKLPEGIEPCDDRCLDASFCDCDQAGPSCFVGVMGWLLACRQA